MKNIIRYCGLLLVGLVSCVEDEAPSVELKVALDKQVYQVGEPVTFKLNLLRHAMTHIDVRTKDI